MTIPNSVTSIDNGAFNQCSGLTSIKVDSGNTVYDSREDCNAIIKTVTNELVAGCKNTVIPNSVTSIGKNAFSGCWGLTSLSIPNSVTSIGDNAFMNCGGLKSITIGNSVTSIGICAFATSGLTAVTIPNSVVTIGGWAFLYCPNLTSVTIPNSVKEIGESAFMGCNLVSVISKIENPFEIKDNVFSSITYANSILTVPVGKKAVYEATNHWNMFERIEEAASNIDFADANVKALCVANWDTNKDGELSTTEAAAVTDLGNVFKNNTSITSFNELLYFTGLTSIGYEAFSYCSGLTSIDIPNSVTTIGEYAFSSCIGLTSVTIPNSVTSIGNYAFWRCRGLTSVIIPNSVTSIGRGAFKDCSSLNTVIVESGNTVYDSRGNCNAIIKTSTNTLITGCNNTVIPNSVTSIGESAFWGRSGLTSVIIPNNVISIGDNAFGNCEGITSITIGNGVKDIGNYSFGNCFYLADVYCYAKVPTTNIIAFKDSGIEYITLHVPASYIAGYKKTSPWNEFGEIVALTDDDPKPTGITSIVNADNVSVVGYYTLDGQRIEVPRKGVNIVKMSDGTVKKVVIK